MTSGSTIPRPPSWLGKLARAEWKRVAPILCERKTLTPGDQATLAALCVAYSEMIEASEQIDAEKITYKTSAGLIKRNPAVAIRAAAITQIRLLSAELGLTPVSRKKSTKHEGSEDDPDSAALGQ